MEWQSTDSQTQCESFSYMINRLAEKLATTSEWVCHLGNRFFSFPD